MNDWPQKVFLLSPANASGTRAQMLLNERANFDLAARLREGAAPVGELFTFVSGLYFRGKVAYATRFANPPAGLPGASVITPSLGLVPIDKLVSLAEFRAMAAVPIDVAEPRYMEPLARDAAALAATSGPECAVVLLGSIATPKYMEPLLAAFGTRLLFLTAFAGRGHMSRGALMLRCACDGVELEYVPACEGVRRGPKPPRLPRLS